MARLHPSEVSTLAVDTDVAQRVRAAAKDNGMTNLEMATALLKCALDQGQITTMRREVQIVLRPPAAAKRAKK